jgi:hypothetical protein
MGPVSLNTLYMLWRFRDTSAAHAKQAAMLCCQWTTLPRLLALATTPTSRDERADASNAFILLRSCSTGWSVLWPSMKDCFDQTSSQNAIAPWDVSTRPPAKMQPPHTDPVTDSWSYFAKGLLLDLDCHMLQSKFTPPGAVPAPEAASAAAASEGIATHATPRPANMQ